MANSTVTDLTAASTLDGTELVYAVQGGADRKATVTQINASRQPLDATLTALAALDSSAGYLKQTGADTFSKVTEFATADMSALRTFVRPLSAATNLGGGFFQSNLFRITLGSPDSASGQLIVHAKIIDATTPKSGAFYYEVPICMQRDALEFGGNIPALLVRQHYDGSTGGGATSVAFYQGALAVSAPNIDISLLIQPANFTNPTVAMSAVWICPGDVTVTVL